MANDNYIKITAQLDKGASTDMIQRDLLAISKKVLLQLHHVEVSQAGTKSLQTSINSIQKNLNLSIGSVNIDQSQTAKQAQQISQNLASAITPSVDLSGIKRAYNEISMIQNKLNAEKIGGFTSQSELSQYINNLLKGFKGITTSVTSLNEVNKAINGFKIEVQNADRVTESLAFHIKDIQGAGSQWALSSFESSDNSIRNMESDACKLNTEFKTLTHYWQMMENLPERSILGKNKDSAEVQNLQAQISWLDKAYNIFKKHFETAPQNPRLTRYVSELQQAIISANSDAHNLVRTLSEQQTSLNPEVELNNLKTLMNNLKASDVEVDKLKADYGELVGLFTQARETGDWTQFLRQLDIFKSKFTEAKSEVRATNAEIADLEKMARNLSSNKMNNFFDKNSGNVKADGLKAEIGTLVTEWRTLNAEIQNTGKITPSLQTRLEELRAKMQSASVTADTLQKEIKAIADEQKLATQKASLNARITEWLQNNTRASQETRQSLLQLQQELQKTNLQDMSKLNQKFREITSNARAAGEAGKTLGDTIREKLGKFAGWFSIATVVMRAVNELKNMYKTVVELDSAMVGLRKVSNETEQAYNDFFVTATKNAKELGATITDIINSTTEFARLGYNLADATKLSEVATLYKNVGDGIDIDQATTSIISTMKAFNITADNTLEIVDKYNKVGNEFAISSGGIGEALQRSASALANAKNSLSESIALTVAA